MNVCSVPCNTEDDSDERDENADNKALFIIGNVQMIEKGGKVEKAEQMDVCFAQWRCEFHLGYKYEETKGIILSILFNEMS